jgi:hypothetical protein
VWNFRDCDTKNTLDPDALSSILQPLQSIESGVLGLEMNVEVPEEMKNSLQLEKFRITHKKRPYNFDVFMLY